MTTTATNVVQEGVFTVLQDATLQALVGDRIYGNAPQDPTYPLVWVEIRGEDDSARGFGTGGLATLDLRTHVFTKLDVTTAHAVNQRIVQLLKDAVVAATGYQQCGRVAYRETSTFPNEELDGDRVCEVVSDFTVWMEQV